MDEHRASELVEHAYSENEEESESSCGSSDEDDADITTPQWSASPGVMGRLRDIPFTGEPGLRVPIPGNNKPIDWFRLLSDVVFLQNIVAETNKYALEFLCAPNTKPKSRITKWKDLVLDELMIFLGLLMHTGTIRMNRLQDYWKTHRLFSPTSSVFSQYMTRDRFQIILRCLNFSGVGTTDTPEPVEQRAFKINPIVDYFNNKMREIYYPGRELTMDEEMVLWRGRLAFRQYVQGKRHKYGIKIYSLNEPGGLILRLHVYTGKADNVAGKGHTANVVMKLMKDFLGKGHSLFMDNFYNSFILSSKLLRRLTYTTGTLCADRKHTPVDVKSATLSKGETITRYAEGIMIGKWKDKRAVTYISSQFDNQMATTTNTRSQQRVMPKPLIQYNAHMKGTDRLDQIMSYYPGELKTFRWHKKIFVHFLQVIMTNAFILYNKHNSGNRLSLYDFRLEVIEQLLPPKPAPLMVTPTRGSLHRLSKNEKRKANGNRVLKKCRVCCKEGKRKETVFICAVCPGEPGLCELRCFDKFHEDVDE
ncbi:piggyBac transposable element-derived protein 4-like [Macrosteles quadrilineatus]|uniref:piggyBac transposable element-derived protein 4-like n=1 Tax=Macrosteles quadrilineatus TaxID=74068 RepID=UPI0023E1F65F|nr:piggyBac transposable element-derived protein 4-like [Macrosteles quadrilineatus]